MSLSFEPENENSKLISHIFTDKNIKDVYITDNDFSFDSGKEKKKGCKKIVLQNPNHYIFPYIENKKGTNTRIYICGKSGVGKTYNFIRPFVRFYLKKNKSKCFFFSSKPHDDAIDDLPIIRYDVDDDFVENPPKIEEFAPKNNKRNLVIFDDIQDYKTKQQNKAVEQLRNEILRNGRSMSIDILYVNHKPNQGAITAEQIFEATATVIFPKQSGHSDYDLILDRYLGVKASDRKILKNAKSKYVYISKSQPAYAITDNYILVL